VLDITYQLCAEVPLNTNQPTILLRYAFEPVLSLLHCEVTLPFAARSLHWSTSTGTSIIGLLRVDDARIMQFTS